MEVPKSPIRAALAYVWNGGPSTDGIPARVMAQIELREARAERLIGWVQLAVVLFFATLYFIAPRAEGATAANYVWMTLAGYFAFTLFRLGLSYRITLPRWVLVLSIVVDICLLCGLIFSFHIQYAQPPAFYLKAPTLAYVFIFIAVRTLRFDPRFVLMTGIFGAVGWLSLVAFALIADGQNMYITRDYVEYMTSNAILVGAEIDKTLTILGVTVILSLALYRGRQLLFDAIRSQAAAEDLSRFFAPEVASSITLSDSLPSAGHGETRAAAILFVDVRAFTAGAEALPPEAVMQVLALYQDTAVARIEQHGGRVDKFLGDGILATFGAVSASETYAADALRAAMAVLAAVDGQAGAFAAVGWQGRFHICAAVASGGVTVGVVGSQGRLEFTVIGHAVNLAAKLENANKDQQSRLLTDADTWSRAEAQGYDGPALDLRPGLAIPGLSRKVDVVVVQD